MSFELFDHLSEIETEYLLIYYTCSMYTYIAIMGKYVFVSNVVKPKKNCNFFSIEMLKLYYVYSCFLT